ncbi:MAG TPA: RES family NAD+ phosphorylase [Gammaproteobacteria bacterium]|nr:RES family NAD+ phosphorylase [Gammaproteobacteria bacterium]
MTNVFRLVRRERAADALSGEGARRYGGRWNPPGAAVVYAAESRALAVLEAFVHLTLEARALRFVLFTLELPGRARLRRHAGAEAPRSLAASQEAARAWLDGGEELALVVPSVIVPQEKNYVLSVAHAQFAAVRVADAEPLSFDDRLWQTRR